MFSKFKKRRLQRKFLILLIVILSSSSTLQSEQNELTNPMRYPNICSVYANSLKGEKLTIKDLRDRMKETEKIYFWSAWQQKLAKEVSNSHHAQTLLELGFRMRTVDGIQKMVPPENLLMPLEIYNRRVSDMIEAGEVQDSEAIFAALLFESVKETEEIKTFRPGIDELPTAHHWRISESRNQIPHSNWAALVANGHMPVSLGSVFYIHDLGHITENLRIDPQTQRPEFMIAVRGIYREQIKEFDKNAENLQHRSFHVLEYMSLGRLDSKVKLRHLRSELFDNEMSLETLKKSLQRLSFEQLDVRLKYWIENEHEFVLKQGGSQRDIVETASPRRDLYFLMDSTRLWSGHNIYRTDVFVATEHPAGYLKNAKLLLDYVLRVEEVLGPYFRNKTHVDPVTNEVIEKDGHGRVHELLLTAKFLSKLRKSLDTDEIKLERVKVQIADQLARFEMSLVKSVELKLTPAQLVYDLAGAHVKPDSLSVEWLRSYLNPFGGRYSLFIE